MRLTVVAALVGVLTAFCADAQSSAGTVKWIAGNGYPPGPYSSPEEVCAIRNGTTVDESEGYGDGAIGTFSDGEPGTLWMGTPTGGYPGSQGWCTYTITITRCNAGANCPVTQQAVNDLPTANAIVVPSADLPIIVGVLEEVKAGNPSPAMSVPHVRVAFQKKGAQWVPFRTDFKTPETLAESYKFYPETVIWSVVSGGKKIGVIASKNPGPPNSHGDVGTQTITTERARIPRPGPLVLVSLPNFKDPEEWKPTTLSEGEKKSAISNFRNRIRSLKKPVHGVPYSDGEIILIGAFRSRSGELLFGQGLDDKRSNFGYWFVLDKRRKIRLLGSEMTPIGAADLDDNGHSEWIFQTARGEHEDGYELLYDDFAKKSSFHWTYH